MSLLCIYCKNSFVSKYCLKAHQTTAKYCLKIQGVKVIPNKKNVECESCNKKFTTNSNYKQHIKKCKKYLADDVLRKENIVLKNNINILESKYTSKINILESKYESDMKMAREIIKNKDGMIRDLQHQLGKIAEKAVSKPTMSARNIQINNIIQKMEPMKFDEFKHAANDLTLTHHKLGAVGYAKFALEGPFKNTLVCTDRNRKIFSYYNNRGELVEDIGLEICFEALCEAIKMKSYLLAQEHYQELRKKFTESEMDNCETMSYAIGLARYRLDKDNKFCREVINYIKKHCNNQPSYTGGNCDKR